MNYFSEVGLRYFIIHIPQKVYHFPPTDWGESRRAGEQSSGVHAKHQYVILWHIKISKQNVLKSK